MKIAAIAVLVILVLLPLISRMILLVYTATKHQDDSKISQPDKTNYPIKTRRYRKSVIIFSSLYFLIVIIAMIWAFSVLFRSFFDSNKELVLIVSFSITLPLATGVYIFLFVKKLLKTNPIPRAGSDSHTRLDWENNYTDTFRKYLGRYFLGSLAICIIVIVIFVVIIILTR
jgi:hypothetical protein